MLHFLKLKYLFSKYNERIQARHLKHIRHKIALHELKSVSVTSLKPKTHYLYAPFV
ncbi:hypothetical protein AAKU67_003365 [Oxalobacteraceae bacterium GrIS 2.11]